MNLPNFNFKIHSTYYKIKNADFSMKLFIIGIVIIIITICMIIYLNSIFLIFDDTNNLIANIIALTVGLMSFLIGIVSLYRTKEMTIYSILYEKRKNSLIHLYEIVLYNLLIIPTDMRLKFINYLLKKNTYDDDIHNLMIEMKNITTVGVLIGKKSFWENVGAFIDNYEVYYLPEQFLDELNFYLNDKTEINDDDVNIILNLIVKHTENEFKIKSLLPI
jgi:hypothetical protein